MECCSHSTNWQGLVDAMPCLALGMLGLIFALFLMKCLMNLIELWSKNCHERKMKEKAFEREKFWKFVQLSQLDKDEEIKNQANELANKMFEKNKDGKENEALKELEKKLEEKELSWYKSLFEKIEKSK